MILNGRINETRALRALGFKLALGAAHRPTEARVPVALTPGLKLALKTGRTSEPARPWRSRFLPRAGIAPDELKIRGNQRTRTGTSKPRALNPLAPCPFND